MSEQTFHNPNPEYEATRLDNETQLDFHKKSEHVTNMAEFKARQDTDRAFRYAGGIELDTGTKPVEVANELELSVYQTARLESSDILTWRKDLKDAA